MSIVDGENHRDSFTMNDSSCHHSPHHLLSILDIHPMLGRALNGAALEVEEFIGGGNLCLGNTHGGWGNCPLQIEVQFVSFLTRHYVDIIGEFMVGFL